jgi:hypothetical protein
LFLPEEELAGMQVKKPVQVTHWDQMPYRIARSAQELAYFLLVLQ